jgi:branched-subunit amino acid aminotransferase/4-amino-4-deoxychorismate lyase
MLTPLKPQSMWLHWQTNQWQAASLTLTTLPMGLWWGASVFSTFRWPLPHAAWLAHHQRLATSCQQLGLTPPPCPTEAWLGLQPLITPPPSTYYKVRLTGVVASPHLAAASASLSEALPLTWLACVDPTPLPPWPTEHPLIRQGVVALSHPFSPTWPTHKTGDFWPALQVQRQVLGAASHHTFKSTHILWQHPLHGYFTETTWANVVWLDESHTLRFAPQGSVLGGVTQQQWRQAASHLGLPFSHEPTTLATPLLGAWVMNAVVGVQPLAMLNQRALPWPVSAQTLAQTLYATWLAMSQQG